MMGLSLVGLSGLQGLLANAEANALVQPLFTQSAQDGPAAVHKPRDQTYTIPRVSAQYLDYGCLAVCVAALSVAETMTQQPDLADMAWLPVP